MKKLLVIFVSLLILCSCSDKNHYSYLSDGDEVIFEGTNYQYTKNNLYKTLKITSEQNVIYHILVNIADLYDIDKDAVTQEVEDMINAYIEMGLESSIISYYGSIDAYRDLMYESALISKLAEIYVDENFDSLVEEQKPVQMQLATFDTIEDAQATIDAVNSGSTFDMAAINNNSTSTPETSIYRDTDSDLVLEVKDYLNSTDTTGLSTIITRTVESSDADGNTTETNTYYLVNIISRNAEDFEDDLKSLISSEVELETIENYFFTKHKIEFYDQDLYEMLSSEFEVLK